MTDRLIRIGSGAFCQARNLQPGDVFKFVGNEYTIKSVGFTLAGDVQVTTIEGPHLWTLHASQDVTMVLKTQEEENMPDKFDKKVLQLIQAFVDERHPDGRIVEIRDLYNDRHLVLCDDGVGVASYILFQPTMPKGYGPARMEQEPTFGRWTFDEDGKETYLGK